jgi:hypothetical protein
MIIGPSYLPVPVSALKIIGLGHDQCVNDQCVNDRHVQVTQLTEMGGRSCLAAQPCHQDPHLHHPASNGSGKLCVMS